MTIESMSLCPLVSTEKRRARVKAAYNALLAEAKRSFTLMTAPMTDFPNTQGEGGWFNNRPANLYQLLGWWLYEDKLALTTACNIADWLIATWGTRDNAHNQRCNWIVATGLAYKEATGDGSKLDKYLAFWLSNVLPAVANAKYLTSLVGSTLRPFIRTVGRAIECAWLLDTLIDADMVDADYEHSAGSMRESAYSQIELWANAILGQPRGGFTYPLSGTWAPSWKNFVYLDNKDPATSARNLTFFMVGHIVPYETVIIELYGDVSPALKSRVRDLSTHAYLFGYDPDSARTLRAVGFKNSGDHTACYAPGFCSVPLSELSPALVEKYAEEGFHDFGPTLLAAELPLDVKRKEVVHWTANAKAVTPGEVPLGLAYVAARMGFGT